MSEAFAQSHPSPELLRRFGSGELSGPEAEAVEQHVATCAACRQQLRELPHDAPRDRQPALLAAAQARAPSTTTVNQQAESQPPSATPRDGKSAGELSVPGYEVEEELGRGGMGVVLRVRDLELCRPLAVKVLLGQHEDNADLEQRFVEEAQVLGQLQHPGVPAVHQLGRLPDGRPFFSMKLVRGQTLAQLLAQRESAAEELPRLLDVFAQVCQTVGYAHSRGILHRDLKPANVMVGAFGEVQVMDWGLAKVLGRPAASGTLTPPPSTIFTVRTSPAGLASQPGTVAGTLAYMAPEQARGEVDSLDQRADVFGLGALLCEILTGQPPYRGSREALHWQASHADLEEALARLQTSGADAELLSLARECLAKEREQRPQHAGVVAERLTAYQRGVQQRLRQAELAQVRAQAQAQEERKRRRVQLLLAATLLLLVLAGGAGAWLVQQQRQVHAAELSHKQQGADADADQVMARCRLLLEQARNAPFLEMVRFQQALSEARQAEQLARTGGASDSVREQAAALAGQIKRETEAAQRDQRLLAELLAVRGPRQGPTYKTDEHGLLTQLAEPSADEQFASAFQSWGLDVNATSVAAAVERLKERPPAVLVQVIAALDEWTIERRRQRLPAARWRHLMELAQTLDSADSKRRELRVLLARGNLSLERALGQVALLLRPVPLPVDVGLGQDRGRLRQLAAEVDATTEPVLGLLTLVRALRVAGEQAQAETLLRTALRARPQEVVLHHSLGQLLESQSPPRWSEAVECYVAVRALRPDLGEPLADALVEVGRAAEGLALYERLTADNPSNPWLHFRCGYALYAQGRPKEAEVACREAIRLKHDDHYAHNGLGAALSAQGRPKEAEAAYRQAIRLKHDFPYAHNGLGVALDAQGRPKEAEAAYREAIRLNHDDPEAHCNLGIALNEQGRPKEAEAACREAIRLKHDDPEAHFNLGNALKAQGRPEEAEAAYREAIRLKHDYHQAHNNLGNALSAQGRPKEAEAAYREAIRLKHDLPQAHNNLGNALKAQGRPKEAEVAFRQAIRLKHDDPYAHSNLGNALKAQGRPKEAEAACREAIRLKHDFPLAHYNLGTALKAQGRPKEAEAAFREAIRLKHDYYEAHCNLGAALGGQGRYQEAEAACREAVRLKRDLPLAHINLGLVLNVQGRPKEAEAAFREAIRLKHDSYEAHFGLGTALNAQGRPKEAEAAYRQAIRLKHAYPEVHCNLGEALKDEGRFGDSLQAYRQGHALGSKMPGWRYPSAQWVRQAERLVELDAKLPAFLAGKATPTSAVERLELAALCQHSARRLHAAAARFAADAFADQPKLAADLVQQFRYSAACSAVLAAVGDAEDAGKLTDKDKLALRQQALDWLRADLTLYGKLAERDDPKVRQAVLLRLTHWQNNADFRSVRDEEPLSKLAQSQRDDWQKLWADVAAVRRRAEAGSPK